MTRSTGAGRWQITRRCGTAAELFGMDPDPGRGRQVVFADVQTPAVVLGSSQQPSVLDDRAVRRAGLEVAVRRSGGGAVLLAPDAALWVDLMLPAGDDLWDDDIRKAPLWVGRTWKRALASMGVEAVVHTGPPDPGPWGRVVCMAGIAPGEVTVRGLKAVGVAQRRTRDAALFQTVALLAWEPDEMVAAMALRGPDRTSLTRELVASAAGLAVDPTALEEALVASLP